MKQLIKQALRYRPLDATAVVRRLLAEDPVPGRPYCPPDEGDLIYRLVVDHGYRHCLETGFGTGSTALYMLAATAATGGDVVSIDWSETSFNDIGRRNLLRSGLAARHTLIEEPSFRVMARFLAAGQPVDFAFIDGWKTFDYLVYELFVLNRLLSDGGCILFDDSHLPAVRRAIRLLCRHYGYMEIDYRRYGQFRRLRLFHTLTRRSFLRPYRAVRKATPLADQPPSRDWTFYRRF